MNDLTLFRDIGNAPILAGWGETEYLMQKRINAKPGSERRTNELSTGFASPAIFLFGNSQTLRKRQGKKEKKKYQDLPEVECPLSRVWS